MKKYFNIIILFVIFFLLASIPISAKIDIGGELAASLINIIDNEGNISAYPQESLDLELFLPTLKITFNPGSSAHILVFWFDAQSG